MNKWIYSGHHFKDRVEGHIFLGHKVKGACTISLEGAASMTQAQLNRYGRKIVNAVNKKQK